MVSPKTSPNAFAKAFDPSMTAKTPSVWAKPRSTRSVSKLLTTVLFSVAPSASPRICLWPAWSMPNATTTRCQPTRIPSIISTTYVRSSRRRAMNVSKACRVA